MRYTKKPVTIEAIQFVRLSIEGAPLFNLAPADFIHAPPTWLTDALEAPEGVPGSLFTSYAPNFDTKLHIGTLEGLLTVSDGDWIVRGVKGELYPVKPDIFAELYDAAAAPACPVLEGIHATGVDALAKALEETNVDHPSDLPNGSVDRLREAATSVISEGSRAPIGEDDQD